MSNLYGYLYDRRFRMMVALIFVAFLISASQSVDVRIFANRPSFVALGEVARGFTKNDGLFQDKDVRYWNRSSLGDSYILGDGRMLHAIPAGAGKISKPGDNLAWVIVERYAPSGTQQIKAYNPTAATTYLGKNSSYSTELQTYQSLRHEHAWPGIDVELRNTKNGIERLYSVRPGGRSEDISVQLEGASDAKIAVNGDIELATGVGVVRFKAPQAFQVSASGETVPINIRYQVFPDRSSFGFLVGEYDTARTLFIDPVLQGAYLGDAASQSIYRMAIDPRSGDVIVAGNWYYGVPPKASGGFQSVGQVQSLFVTRCDSKLQQVIQSTLLGGSTSEDVRALAIDPSSGDVLVGGRHELTGFSGCGNGCRARHAIRNLGHLFSISFFP